MDGAGVGHDEMVEVDREGVLGTDPMIRTDADREEGRMSALDRDDEVELEGRSGRTEEDVGELEDLAARVILCPDPEGFGRAVQSVVPIERPLQRKTDLEQVVTEGSKLVANRDGGELPSGGEDSLTVDFVHVDEDA